MTASTNTMYFLLFFQLPCIMWLSIYKPKRWGLSWTSNWVWFNFLCFFDIVILSDSVFISYKPKLIGQIITDLHNSGSNVDCFSTNWWLKNHHYTSQGLQFFLLGISRLAHSFGEKGDFKLEVSFMFLIK